METKKYTPTDYHKLAKSSKRLPCALESKPKPEDSERHIIRSTN